MSDEDMQEHADELAAARRVQGRASVAASPFAAAGPERTVECIDCRQPVGLSAFAWQFAKQASEILLQRGEKHLANHEMTRCPPCVEAWQAEMGRRYQHFLDLVNLAQHDANTRGVVNEPLVGQLRHRGFGEWADCIESAAARFGANVATRGRAGKERK